MKNIFSSILRSTLSLICFISIIFAAFPSQALPPSGTLSITWPLNRSVFQRNSSNQANVTIAGQFFYFENTTCPNLGFYYKVERLNLSSGSYVSDQVGWTQFVLSNVQTGTFSGSINNLPAGWYDLKIKATDGSVDNVRATATIRFGVGDVFVVAGQSNTQSIGVDDGFDDVNYLPTDSYDCVSAHNFDGQCKPEIDGYPVMAKLLNQINPNFRTGASGFNSWCYSALGRQIADNEQVPTAFFNAAMGGTSVGNWVDGINGLNTTVNGEYLCKFYHISQEDAKGQPYRALKNALKYYAKIFGIKAVLWHQGESDANTSTADYQSKLQTIINQSRADFGSSDLTWFVARASRNNFANYANVIAGQNNVIGGNVKAGPATDDITTRLDGTHMYMSGLTELATRWRTSISSNASNPFSPNPLPLAQFILGQAGYPLQANSGFSAYAWQSRTAPHSTTNIATSNASQFCYVKDVNGNWLVTPIYIRGSFCGVGSARMSAEHIHENIETNYNFMISANPVVDKSSNITFDMPYSGNVIIEITDGNGRKVKRIANGIHASGKYSYPLWMHENPSGTYICVLQADGVSMSKRFVLMK